VAVERKLSRKGRISTKEILKARKLEESSWNKTTAFVVFFTTSVAKMFTTKFCELFHDNILRERSNEVAI
jgi:hypothetical protein